MSTFLPAPTLPFHCAVPAVGAPLDLSAMPARPGVFVLEDDTGRTVAVTTSADVRRRLRARLAPPDDERPSRRVDYRAVTTAVRAVPVGSPFEADWAYLQLVRRRLPHALAGVTDRWRGWFARCNAESDFPRFVRTARPETPAGGICLGPMQDQRAAQRYIEMLIGVFDLCRYHHLLLEAPHAAACAYKEMGRCPAPCDGTVSMASYRDQIVEAIDFAATPIEAWRAGTEQDMARAAEALAFEEAERLRRRLGLTDLATGPAFAHVDRLDRFRYVGVFPSERAGWARLFAVSGGWIAPVADVPLDEVVAAAPAIVRNAVTPHPVRTDHLSDAEVENIGLVSFHLFQPRGDRPGALIALDRAERDPKCLRAVAAGLRGSDEPSLPEERDTDRDEVSAGAPEHGDGAAC